VLDLHRLRLLRELKHRGTLAAVADALSYTPSAISQQLSVLEAEAGVPLLERAGRRVRLTPAAERLVEHTEAILERLEQARADLDASAASIGGTVRVAAFHTTAHAVIPAALSALAAAHPALRVEVTEREPETSLPGLIAHEFDLALLEEYPGHPQRRRPELDYRQLATDRMRLAQAAGAPPRPLADLASTPPPGAAPASTPPWPPSDKPWPPPSRGPAPRRDPRNEQHRMTPWRQVSLAGVIRCCVSSDVLGPGCYPARAGGPWLCRTFVLSLFHAVVVPSGFTTRVQPRRWIITWWW
jgi:DNA-binding transcriptional LysR family regulator